MARLLIVLLLALNTFALLNAEAFLDCGPLCDDGYYLECHDRARSGYLSCTAPNEVCKCYYVGALVSQCTKFCPAYVSTLLLPLILEQKHLRAALLALQQKRVRNVQYENCGDVGRTQRPENQRDKKKRSFCATVAFRERLGKRRAGAEAEPQDPQSSTAAARVARSVAGNTKKLHGAHVERGPSAETHNGPLSSAYGTNID